jgi:cytochrome c oxidase subunit 2
VLAGGCRSLPPGKPPSQLTAAELRGRAVFAARCAGCHNAYTTAPLHGPSLFGVFRRGGLPSGAPASDERVEDVIRHGHGLMPPAGDDLAPAEMADLLRYLHTL